MTNKRIDVFISSTSRDLALHRDKVRNAIIARKMHPIMMEDFPAISRDAVDLCRTKVDEAQLFIGIYARRYGYCPNDGDKSITEMEYDWAEEDGIERLVFVLDETHEWDDDHPIAAYADDDPRLKGFLNRIGQQIVWKTFTTPEDLALKVSQSLEVWEDSQPATVPVVNPPSDPISKTPAMVPWLAALLRAIVVGIILYFGWRLFDANPSTFLETETVIAALVALVPVFFTWRLREMFSIVILLVAIPIVWFGGMAVLESIGDQQITDAIRAGDINEAQTLLDSAERLDVAIEPRLQSALLEALDTPVNAENDERVTLLSRLYATNITAESQNYAAMSEALQTGLADSIAEEQVNLAERYATALTTLNPTLAGEVATSLNDSGVNALAQGDFDTAQVALETVRTIDTTDETIRSQAERGTTLYNLGVLYERDDSLSDNLVQAETAYRAALDLDSHDYVTRYALASLLLLTYPDDDDQLRDAIATAQRGLDALPDGACNVSRLGGTIDERWYCFLLLTTEAGAWLALDDPDNALPATDRATRLAEANDQFGSARYTAEAYYYRALLTEPDTATETLCNIITQRNRDSDRHQEWAQYASAQLGDTRCTP